jgi:hypothetical protein
LPLATTIILLPVLLAGASDAATASRPTQLAQLAQLTIEQRVIIRIPTMPPRATRSSLMTAEPPPAPAFQWRELKGPKCLALHSIRGAVITMANGVTMIAGRTERYRAYLDRACRPADFYAGFYVSPNKDGALCAGRDMLHARNGSACEIEKFSRLVAEPVPPPSPEAPPPPPPHR